MVCDRFVASLGVQFIPVFYGICKWLSAALRSNSTLSYLSFKIVTNYGDLLCGALWGAPFFSISEKISRWWQDCRAIHLKREALDMKTCFILSACDTAPFLWLEPVSIIQPISMLLLGKKSVWTCVCVLVHPSKRTGTFYSRSPIPMNTLSSSRPANEVWLVSWRTGLLVILRSFLPSLLFLLALIPSCPPAVNRT